MAPPDTRQRTLGFSQAVMNHPFRIASVESMKAAARAAGVRLLVTDGRGDPEVEAANIAWLLERGVDAIVVSSLTGRTVHSSYRLVTEMGIPLVLFASGVPDDDTPYTAFVGPDDAGLGREAGDVLGRRLNGSGRVLIVRGNPESSNSRLRSEGFEAVLAERHPGVEIVDRLRADWLRRPAYEAVETALTMDSGIDAIFSENDEMALGAVDVVRGRGQQSRLFVVGLDGQAEAAWEVSLGPPLVMTISIDWDAGKALDVALAAARGKTVPRSTFLPSRQIDADSAAARVAL